MHIILTTPRFYLRQFRLDDAPLLRELNGDPEVVKYVHEPVMDTVGKAVQVLTDIILPQYHLYNMGRWAVHLKENNEFVGWCGLKTIGNIIDLGYRFHRHNWGKGYATEAATHVVDYGFKVLQISLITAHAHIENLASQHVLKKTGMQFIKEEIADNCPVKTYTISKPSN
jgi:RimJ/RimL family protein N-acetyltransferase